MEATENVLLDDRVGAVRVLTELKALGVGCAIDDFGTGCSSLTCLKRFPVDAIKVDRTVVAGLGPDRQDTAIVAAVINLAHALDLTVVAGGIETGQQLTHIRSLGCDLAQGHYLSRPLEEEDLRDAARVADAVRANLRG